MRISTNTVFQTGTNRLMDLQNDMSKLNEQISSGKRVRSPADDPIAAARILELGNAKNMNDTYTNTRSSAQGSLETYESNLTSITNVVLDVQSALVSAGNGGYNDQQRKSIATDLQARLESLIGLANVKDAQGRYLYAGFDSANPAFSSTGTFQGDSNRLAMQVDVQRQMSVTFSGDQVFQANGNDLFATLQSTIALLNTPVTDATSKQNLTTGIGNAITGMQGALDQVLNVRAEIGSKLNEIDTLNVNGSDLELQYTKSLSTLEDLDYTEALSELAKKNTILEAAQKSFVSTSQLSLFSFI